MLKRTLIALALLAAGSLHAGAYLPATDPDNSIQSRTDTSDVVDFDINAFVGADTFYSAGYTGSSAIVANIEAGHGWDGHESMSNLDHFLDLGTTASGEYDRHATWTAQVIAGTQGAGSSTPATFQNGIAYDATLWSGAIAESWNTVPNTYVTGFNINTFSNLLTPYQDAVYGNSTNGATADVINSSWGSGGLNDGGDVISMSLDALANDSGKTFVFSAGNAGSGPDNVGAPGSGYNSITVGAIGDKPSGFDTISSFSSRSPSSVYNPATDSVIPGATRAAVDIVAPGEDIVAAFYGGATGGFDGTAIPGDNLYSTGLNGTSFSAPTVAGGATLVVDAARGLGVDAEGADGRVVKSILMNSADKNILSTGDVPWNNGQFVNGSGVIETTQALDYGLGAGSMNLDKAYTQLTGGTMGVAGLGSGNLGYVSTVGWDLGQVTEGTANEYYIAQQLAAGTDLTVTLNWFIDVLQNGLANDFSGHSFDDLSLEVWKTIGGVADTLVAVSDTAYDNVEHLFFEITETAEYMIRVLWDGEVWDLADDANSELYGLAWFGTAALIDTPVAIAPVWLLMLLGALAMRRRLHA